MRASTVFAAVIGLSQVNAAFAAQPSAAVDRNALDRRCPACTDFNRFANGGWIDSATSSGTIKLEHLQRG